MIFYFEIQERPIREAKTQVIDGDLFEFKLWKGLVDKDKGLGCDFLGVLDEDYGFERSRWLVIF